MTISHGLNLAAEPTDCRPSASFHLHEIDRRGGGGYHFAERMPLDGIHEDCVMADLITSISTEGEGVGYGTHSMGHPKCHKSSIGCDPFMSKVFNE